MHAAQTAEKLVAEVFEDYRSLKLGFIDASYWETLRLTYVRTLFDVINLRNSESKDQIANFNILEIGAFSGIVTTALRKHGFRVTAQDIPLFMHNPALMAHFGAIGARVVASDLRNPVPLPSDSYDLVVCCEVLEHLNFNILPVLREFNRLLKKGGTLYLATPNQANIVKRLALMRGRSVHDPIERLEWQLDPQATFSIGLHWREFTAAELVEVLKMCHFRVNNHSFCHYNARNNSSRWRRTLVSAMYSLFPSFLPGQIVVGQKL